tara:strand:- start:5915 stop:6298 length:384 start_codon:yes stop_codon:yes gene_type:complete
MDKIVLSVLSVFITLIFLVSGINHLKSIKSTASYLRTISPFDKADKSFNYLVAIVAGLIETVSPILILLSIFVPSFYFIGCYAAYALAFFILCTIVFIHNPMKKDQRVNFMKNLSMLGGVLLLAQII